MTSQLAQMDEASIEAARKQKIRNLQLKTVCLENEELIQELHLSEMSTVPKAKLDAAHDKEAKLISNVEQGTRWNLTPAYDLPKLIRVCGLQLDTKELYQPTDQAQFMDIIALRKTMQELKQHKNKKKVNALAPLLDEHIALLEEAEQVLRRSQVDATDVAAIPTECLKVVEECMDVSGSIFAMAGNDERIAHQMKLIERANEVQNVALADGEMQIAEEQYYTKISLQEALLELVNNKFTILEASLVQNKAFENVAPVEAKAKQATSHIREGRARLKTSCEGDLLRLKQALDQADLDDKASMQRYGTFRRQGEDGLQENLQSQEKCWSTIQSMERELQKLGTERFEQVKRILEELDKEEKRRVEYNQFLEVASDHRRSLELSLFNCDVSLNLIDSLQGFVGSAVRHIENHYDSTERDMREYRLEVCKEQLGAFRQLYLTLGQLKYKKEQTLQDLDQLIREKHIQLEISIETFNPKAKKHSDSKKELFAKRAMAEEEYEMVKDKMERLCEEFAPTAESLEAAGAVFVHPETELQEMNLHRKTKIIGYKVSLAQQEEAKITNERQAIKQQYIANQGSPLSQRSAEGQSPAALRSPLVATPGSSFSAIPSPPRIRNNGPTSPHTVR